MRTAFDHELPLDAPTAPARWWHGPGRRAVRYLALLLAALATVVLVASSTARSTVLNRGYYQAVLDHERAYDRLYDEVLTDPRIAPATRELLDRGPLPAAVVTANLKTLIPPGTTRRLVGNQIDALTAYLRGNRDDLHLTVDLNPVLENLESIGELYLGDLVASLQQREQPDFDSFLRGLDQTVQQIAAGRRPTSLPEVELGPKAVPIAADLLLGPLPDSRARELRPRVTDLLSTGDLPSALAEVGPYLLGDRAGAAGRELAAITEDGHWDPVPDLEGAGADLTALHTARSFTRLGLGLVQTLAVGVGAGSLLVLWLTGPRGTARRIRLLGAALAAGGALALAGTAAARFFAGRLMVRPPLTWPESVAALADDVQREAAQRLITAGVFAAAVPLAAGLALAVGATVWTRAAARQPGSAVVPRPTRVRAAAAGAAAIALTGAAAMPLTVGGQTPRLCNGSEALCGLRYDEAAYLASHNAMSTTADRFIGPLQDADITGQLDAGARALLLDTHTWERPDEIAERLRFSDFTPSMQRRLTEVVDRANPTRPGLWLCHAVCRGGAVRLVPELKRIGDWLRDNPGEVLTLIVQDGITGEQTRDAFRRAGLEEYLFTPDPDLDAEWPTLGDMVDSGRRLVVTAEKGAGPARWYRNFYDYGMETPYAFRSPEEMSCLPNRGGTGKRLFLMNHFVTVASGSRLDAGRVNARDFVLHRARSCERQRGRPVNFVAVDYLNIGDAKGAVDALNEERVREN